MEQCENSNSVPQVECIPLAQAVYSHMEQQQSQRGGWRGDAQEKRKRQRAVPQLRAWCNEYTNSGTKKRQAARQRSRNGCRGCCFDGGKGDGDGADFGLQAGEREIE